MTVYIEKENRDHVRYTNGTGADLDQYEFCVVGPYAAVADEDIANDAEGSFHVEEGIEIQTDDLVTSEDTFATLGQEVFWSSVDQEFSDTETAGYYHVGYLSVVKDANDVIKFEKLRYAVIVTT
jgi:hypothetical protein